MQLGQDGDSNVKTMYGTFNKEFTQDTSPGATKKAADQ